MKSFAQQLKWQFVLLQKNNIVSISLAVTLIYGVVLYFFKDMANTDQLLVAIILNDPTIIGYLFIALMVSSEIKHQILPAIFVSPVKLHHYLLSRVMALSVIALLSSLALPFFSKGGGFDVLAYSVGCLGIGIISALMGLIMLTFATEFLRFAMYSVPVILLMFMLPLFDYLGAVEVGFIKYLLPIQGSLELIIASLTNSAEWTDWLFAIASLLIWTAIFYTIAQRLFLHKIIRQSL